MATRWYIDTTATKAEAIAAFNQVFLLRPALRERVKFWSKAAQLRSNLEWESASAVGADVAARLKRGGLREAVESSKYGGGSIIGTTIAMRAEGTDSGAQAQLWLAQYNTVLGVSQQSDILKSLTKQVANHLRAGGAKAAHHK